MLVQSPICFIVYWVDYCVLRKMNNYGQLYQFTLFLVNDKDDCPSPEIHYLVPMLTFNLK